MLRVWKKREVLRRGAKEDIYYSSLWSKKADFEGNCVTLSKSFQLLDLLFLSS